MTAAAAAVAAAAAAEADDEDEYEDEGDDVLGPDVQTGRWRDSGMGTSLDDGTEVGRRQRRRKGFLGAEEEL